MDVPRKIYDKTIVVYSFAMQKCYYLFLKLFRLKIATINRKAAYLV
jgi:hypothetical protein